MKGEKKTRGSQGDCGWEDKIRWGICNRLNGAKPEEICTWVSLYILSWVLTQDFAVLCPLWAKLGTHMAFLQKSNSGVCIRDKCTSITLCSAQGGNAVCTCRTSISLLITVTTALFPALATSSAGRWDKWFSSQHQCKEKHIRSQPPLHLLF